MEILLRAATERLHRVGKSLREDGWDATISVARAEPHEDHFYDVNLSIRLGYAMRIPVEALDGATPPGVFLPETKKS
jgi:hypothetical protein